MATQAPPRNLGPWHGVYKPSYQLRAYKQGLPNVPIDGVNWQSVTSVQTQKLLTDLVGTFSITLKDARARQRVGAMDVITIRLKGHNQGWGTVLKCLVDSVGPSEQASVSSAQQNTVITGRCLGKYLQSTSMFLPVFSAQSAIPTVLTFGSGDASQKLGTNVNTGIPAKIFKYIYDHFVVGASNSVGLSGIPAAQNWLNATNRFEQIAATNGKPFSVPFVQFDEDTCDTALTRLVIQGFSEGWVDELGNVVYRRPGWDLPVSWNLATQGLVADTLQDTDVGRGTYVEVYPGAFPAAGAALMALAAGRAPIPSDWANSLKQSGAPTRVSPEFIIDTDDKGKPTDKGKQNWYYQAQRIYGLRPYQITSPLLALPQDAQAQAEGILRLLNRLQKSGTVTIPGEPGVMLGQNLYLHGSLRGQKITRTFYVEGVAHDYVENDHYTTTLTLTHGRDPSDPHWQDVALPNWSAQAAAEWGGVISKFAPSSSHNSSLTTPGSAPSGHYSGTPNSRGVINPIPGFTISQLDFGVDCDAADGTPVLAPADCHIAGYIENFNTGSWGTQHLVLYQFDVNLPGAPSQYWFASEGLTFVATANRSFKQGDVIAQMHQGGTGVEIGWGTPDSSASYRLGQLKLGPGADHTGPGGDGPQNVYGNSFKAYFGIP